jgi:hypothetical protein
MNTPSKFFSKILLILLLLAPSFCFAWGERGHHTICEVAAKLVKSPELASLLKEKTHMMGHVCNVPDIYWRNLGTVSKSGDATHFLDPENLGYSLNNLPTDYQQILTDKQGKYSEVLKKNIDVAEDLGSSWWRYDQFYRRALADEKTVKELDLKLQNLSKEDPSLSDLKDRFNNATVSMITNMGLMGHFIGDASQPYHNTNDYDGWQTNQGGIHAYYETKVVSELPLSLQQEVYDAAIMLAGDQTTNPTTAIEKIRSVSLAGLQDLPRLRALDVVLEPSKVITHPDGSETKTPAKRKNPSETAKDFKAMIINEMALSALGLAQTWDQINLEAGSPSFKSFSSFKYPLQPDFVAPDYTSKSPISTKHKKKK